MIELDIPLFASLPQPALDRVRRAVEKRRFKPGEAMLNEGELRGELFILQEGEALVVGRDWHGELHTLARLGPGDCFGELSMLSGEPASATVEAATAAEAWVLPHAEFVSIAADYPELGRNLSALLAERLRLSNERELRAQRAQVVAVVAPDAGPRGFWLAYQLARSIAKHLLDHVAFFDLSGRASELLGPGAPVRALDDAVSGLDLPVSPGAGDCLHVISRNGTDGESGEPASALNRLRERARFVVVYAPERSAGTPGLRPDISLHLVREGRLAGAAESAPAGDDVSFVVLGEGAKTATLAELRTAQAALGARVRAVIPGGEKALDRTVDAASPAGRAVDRLARRIAGVSVGLALGGGGAKGYAHIGVVRALEALGMPFDAVSGCSIGAPLAAGVAAGWTLDEIRAHLNAISEKAVRPNVPLVSILTSRSVRAGLRDLTEDARFDELDTPLGIVAVDIETGREVLLRTGVIWPALLASMAYPGIYEPVRIGPYQLVDGGVLNPVPVSACVTLGADLVISSNLGARNGDPLPPVATNVPKRRRLIVENIARSLEIMQSKIVEESCNRADVAIEPAFGTPPGLLDFKRGREFEDAGEEAVARALPKLRAVFPWLK